MTGLCRRVYNSIRFNIDDQVKYALPVTNVQFVMHITCDGFLQPLLVPSGVTTRSKEYSALIVIYSMYFPTEMMKVNTDFRSNQTRCTGYK